MRRIILLTTIVPIAFLASCGPLPEPPATDKAAERPQAPEAPRGELRPPPEKYPGRPGLVVDQLLFLKDGRHVLTRSWNRISLWDITKTYKYKRTETHYELPTRDFVAPQGYLFLHMDASADGKRLAATCGDHVVRIWDLEIGGEPDKFDGWTTRYVAFRPEGNQLLVAPWQGPVIAVLDLRARQPIEFFAAPVKEGGLGVLFSPDGKRALVTHGSPKLATEFVLERADDQTQNNYRTEPDAYAKLMKRGVTLREPEAEFALRCYSADGSRAATQGRELKIWDVKSGECVAKFSPTSAAALDTKGDTLFEANDDTVIAFDCRTGKSIEKLPDPKIRVRSIALSPDERFLALGGLPVAGFEPWGRRLADGTGDLRMLLVWDRKEKKYLRVTELQEDK